MCSCVHWIESGLKHAVWHQDIATPPILHEPSFILMHWLVWWKWSNKRLSQRTSSRMVYMYHYRKATTTGALVQWAAITSAVLQYATSSSGLLLPVQCSSMLLVQWAAITSAVLQYSSAAYHWCSSTAWLLPLITGALVQPVL